ncbi:MAG TPA: GNVR domain-containing protein, partial [Candidatus Polarisedimenticolia bacterium]|nr:GNVR domain-containing protein [Candidatus Polarisedimenticolia bacterium]
RPEDGLPDTTARLSKAAPARADPTIRVLESEEDRLRREIGIYRARVDRAPQREQEFARMSRDHSTTKELYSTLLKRYQEAKIADDLERERKGGQLRILDSAIVPPAPYAPNRGRLMLFALMASLAFAVGVVALAERIDTSFHSVDDLRSFTRVPVLVSIPPLSSRADRWRNRWQFAWRALVTLTGLVLIGAATWSIAHGNLDLAHLLARGGTS